MGRCSADDLYEAESRASAPRYPLPSLGAARAAPEDHRIYEHGIQVGPSGFAPRVAAPLPTLPTFKPLDYVEPPPAPTLADPIAALRARIKF